MKRICSVGIVEWNCKFVAIFRRKIKEGIVTEYYAIPGGGVENGKIYKCNIMNIQKELYFKI